MDELAVRGKYACRVVYGDLVRGTSDLIWDAMRVDFSLSLFLMFDMRHELSRGTVDETVDFEQIEKIGEPDEEAAVYR